MTHDPSLPTLDQFETITNGNNPFELVTIPPFGEIERWRAEAMLIGTTGGIQSVYDAVRADAAAQVARADATEALGTLVKHVCDKISEFERRFDAHVARLAEAEAKRRADENAAREFEEEPLSLPPGDPPGADPVVAADQPTDDPPGISKDPGELPEPSLELEDSLGDLPEKLRDLPDPVEPPKGKVYPQPIAISLNKE
jgi:hypothetical protein